MTTKWTARRPPIRLYGSWDGDNLVELETLFPEWTFSVNLDGSLLAESPPGVEFSGDVQVGHWFTTDGYSEGDPTLTDEVQEAPEPGPSGLVSYDITADD